MKGGVRGTTKNFQNLILEMNVTRRDKQKSILQNLSILKIEGASLLISKMVKATYLQKKLLP